MSATVPRPRFLVTNRILGMEETSPCICWRDPLGATPTLTKPPGNNGIGIGRVAQPFGLHSYSAKHAAAREMPSPSAAAVAVHDAQSAAGPAIRSSRDRRGAGSAKPVTRPPGSLKTSSAPIISLISWRLAPPGRGLGTTDGGASPRARGKTPWIRKNDFCLRFIPVRAAPARARPCRLGPLRVHPRVCGSLAFVPARAQVASGRPDGRTRSLVHPPLRRGNGVHDRPEPFTVGPSPRARGSASAAAASRFLCRVHPRTRGVAGSRSLPASAM